MISAMTNTQAPAPAFYFPGKPGEVSYTAAARQVADLLAPSLWPACQAATIARTADTSWMRREGIRLVAAGAMAAYLRAAALREATQGEGDAL